MELTRNFKKLSKNDVAIAGGKGASLGEMTLAGIPVPTGFVILSDSFERFIKESELVAEIDACLDSVNHEEIHTVENASEKIKALIMDKEIPKDISKEIIKDFNKLGAKFVAVRSSATSEDSASAAWAGQLESYLNTTKESLLENVKKCWASLFTPRAIFYRFEKNLHKEKVSVAVVVQKMIESEESGIAFSVHPVTQDYNQLIIEAGFGLGEAIVSGQITPDSYVVDKRSYEIIEKNISVQTRGIYRLAKGGNEWRDIPQKKGEKQVLSNKEIIELSKLIIKIEKHYGFPVDVEWARSGGKFYIVQSRPITTLTEKKEEEKDKEILPFANNSEIFRWGPIPGRYFYASGDIIESFFVKKYKDYSWPDSFYLFKNGKMVWLTEFEKIQELGKKIFIEYMLNKNKRKEIWLDWGEKVKDLTNFEKKIDKLSLSKLSDKELIQITENFYELLISYWGTTLFVELGNYGGEKYLKEKISNLIKDKNEIMRIMEIITAPEDLSFYQLEEITLFKSNNLKNHQKKYFWIKNSHNGTEILPIKFFKDRKLSLNKNLITNLKNNQKFNKDQKILIKKKFNLTEEIWTIADAISKGIIWQDRRKMNTFISLYYKDLFRLEISKRKNISSSDFLNVDFSELIAILKGKDFHVELEQRKQGVGIFGGNGYTKLLSSEENEKYWNLYAKEKNKIIKTDIITGIIASSRGKIVRGRVRILLDPADPIENGEILVTTLTSPEYIFAMRKSSAIITDSGGLGSHAAIISRELGIPCIIGTKIATQVLHDGDFVEVDADKGVVRVLERTEKNKETLIIPKKNWEVFRSRHIPCILPILTYWTGSLKEYLGIDKGFIVNVWDQGDYTAIWEKEVASSIGNEMINRLKKNINHYNEIREKASKAGSKVSNYSKVFASKVNSVSINDIISFLETFKILYRDFIRSNMLYWLFSAGILESDIRKNLTNFNPKEINYIFNIMSQPTEKSYSQKEEEEFENLVDIARKSGIKNPGVKKKIKLFSEKYFWFPFEYVGPEVWDENSIEKRIIEELNKLTKEKKHHDLKKEQQECIKRFKLSKEIVNLFKIMQEMTLLQDDRKMFHSQTCYYLNGIIIKEIAKRIGITLNEAYYLDVNLLKKYAKGFDIRPILKDSSKFLIIIQTDEKDAFFSGEDGKKVLKSAGIQLKISNNNLDEIKGQAVYSGLVKGKVRILKTSSNIKDFEEGDILVTGMTTPDFAPLIKKASAIITDEGGITSHAAIVAREMKKPCIIGTKIATQVLHDGDYVEVDADRGVVKILERMTTKKSELNFQKMWEAHDMGVFGGESVVGFNVTGNKNLKKRFGITEKNCLFYYEKGIGTQFYYDKKEMEEAAEYGLRRFTDKKKADEYIEDCKTAINNSDKYYKEFIKLNWKKLSVGEIYRLFKEQLKILEHSYGIFYACQPQYFDKIEKFVLTEIGKSVDTNTANEIFSTLTLPDELDALGIEELEWLNIVKSIKQQNKKVFSKENLSKEFIKKIQEHSDRYLFLGTVESKHPWTFEYYLKLLNEQINTDIIGKIQEINDKKRILIEKKKNLIRKYNIDKEIVNICNNISKLGHIRLALRFAWTKDIYVYTEYQKEISKAINLKSMKEYKLKEIEDLVEKNIVVSENELKNRERAFLFVTKDLVNESPYDNIEFYSGEEAIKKKKELVPEENINVSEIKGNIACRGKVRGRVYKFTWLEENLIKKMDEMKKGDILVAGQTRPFLMPAIRKAGAIVADEGGIAGHASIVSRELNIPCIIGTKIATKVLETGDLVEVDADLGVVKILKRENKKVEEESNSKDNTINWVNHISRDMSLTAIWYPYYSYTQGLKLFNANGQNMLYFSNKGFIKGYKDKAGQEVTYKGIRKVVSEGRLREVLMKFEELIKQRELLVNEFCTADLSKKTIDWIKNKVNNFHEFYITYWNYHLFCFNLGEALIKTEFEKLLEDNKELVSRVRKVNPFLIFDEKFLPHLYDYLSKKENIDKQLLFYLLPQELLNYLNKNYKLNVKELSKRKEYSLLADIYGKELFDSGDNALKKYNEIIPKEESIQIINEFKGNPAFKGKARGLVTIVKLKKDLEKIKDGSILVTYQTTPEFTPYLKKVAGIITDEGGVASHASIISRELKIPCIIATKIATQVLHDGDLVEVDADMGVVKVLEKGKESLSEDPTYIDGKKWDLTITRNMSFWHQYLSDIGHVHNTKDFGIDGSLEIMSLTVDGTHTSAFNNQTNSSEINKKIIDLISKKDGIKIIKEKYKKNAKELFNSLKKCKIKLNIKNWDDFQKKYQKFAAGLYLTVIIGRSGGELLFNKLKDAGYKEQDIPEIISYITYPNESTPLFKSQKDMLKIGKKIQNKKLDKNKIDKELKSWLIEHQHIPINFCEDPWTIEDTRKQLIDFLKKDCEKELIFFEKSHQERIKKKQEILNKIDNKEISILANAIAEGTYLNEFRKNVFSKVSLEYRDIFKTIAKKGNSNNWRDVYYLTPQETLSLLEGKKFAIADKIKERKYVLLYPNSDGEIVIADSAKTKSLVDFVEATYGKSNNTQINQETELKGFSANKGKVSGIVKVILSSKDFHKINRNEILVTTMTSVDFVPIMEKAAAFVTNEGGITSHASIVAREMNKPCIIGTKIATQVLHDGDLVEVDADSGVVRVLERVK